MTGEGTRDGEDVSRRIREELERIRDSEARVEEALEAVRQARRRVEVIARELGREEERVRAWVREELREPGVAAAAAPAPLDEAGRPRSEPGSGGSSWRDESARTEARAAPAPDAERRSGTSGDRRSMPATAPRGTPASSARPAAAALPPEVARPGEESAQRSERRMKLALIGAVAVILVLVVGVFAIRGLRQGGAEPAAVPGASGPQAAGAATPPDAPARDPGAGGASVLAALPADVAEREALYDSLWSARSPLFDAMIAVIRDESSDRDVEAAADAWVEGEMDAEESDLLHSAFLQHVLNQRIDERVAIDGQVLRNPCRGSSCSALLNVWEVQAELYDLPAIPDDAPTNTGALRQVEAALLLDWMREANGVARPAPEPGA